MIIVSTSRADFSIFRPLIFFFAKEKIDFAICCLGEAHKQYVEDTLSSDGLRVKIFYIKFNDKPKTRQSFNQNFTDVFDYLTYSKQFSSKPILLILGDRYELLPIAIFAFFNNCKLVHFCGGDITIGSKDDKVRDQLSLISNLHFVTNQASETRLINLGLNSGTIFNCGHIGLANPKYRKITKREFEDRFKFKFGSNNFLVTLHPDTTKTPDYNKRLVQNVFEALGDFDGETTSVLFTGSNADLGAYEIEQFIEQQVSLNSNYFFVQSLGSNYFYNALELFDVFIGNSSSIFYEAPSFPIVSVNIGERQKGRVSNESIHNVDLSPEQIAHCINFAKKAYPMSVENPYYNPNCMDIIINNIKAGCDL